MHLFIVSETTLPVSLEYGFAGTRREKGASWSEAASLHPSSELAQAWQYADICGVHRGDEVLFYLEKPPSDAKREGGHFFGVFQCASDAPFFEPEGEYLREELGMRISYRLLVEPQEVYPRGLTEWYMMDEMGNFRDILDVPWTVIYRKMAGGRGCTPLLPHEARNIRRMLDVRNAGRHLSPERVGYSPETISLFNGADQSLYTGEMGIVPDIRERAVQLIRHPTRKAEMHVEAYLMQSIGRDPPLTAALFPGVQVDWTGNEIYCGAGMQRIDILVYTSNRLNWFVNLLELKASEADRDAASQLNRYVKWLRAHIPGITPHQIIPTIVCPGASQSFHDELRTYLRGHGIDSYREMRYNADAEVELLIHDF